MSTPEQRAKKAAYMKAYLDARPDQRAKVNARRQQWREANRERHRAYQRAYVAEHGRPPYNPDYHRRNLLKRMGLTQSRYDEIIEAQGGGCFFCGATGHDDQRQLCIDHDHATQAVRGILCFGCNVSLGYFERGWRSKLDPAAVAEYLKAASRWL